jgi:alkylhydroperoxidase/carboxymuconolactone decarboxylase family protein YurZ
MERISGRRIIALSVLVGVIGCAPLLLYIALGPAGGNPIELGLLMMLCAPVALVGTLVGLLKCLLENFEKKETP